MFTQETMGHLQTTSAYHPFADFLPTIADLSQCPLQRLAKPRACQCLVSSHLISVFVCVQRAVLMRSAAETAGQQTP